MTTEWRYANEAGNGRPVLRRLCPACGKPIGVLSLGFVRVGRGAGPAKVAHPWAEGKPLSGVWGVGLGRLIFHHSHG